LLSWWRWCGSSCAGCGVAEPARHRANPGEKRDEKNYHNDLIEFSQAFWAQSIDLKCQHGWQPQSASDFPRRIYEALSATLDRPPDELETWMGQLIAEWKQQAGEVLTRFGYAADW
jgi:hypothetical protein